MMIIAVVVTNFIFSDFSITIMFCTFFGSLVLLLIFIEDKTSNFNPKKVNKILLFPILLGILFFPFEKIGDKILNSENFSTTRLKIAKSFFLLGNTQQTLLQDIVKSGNLEAVKYMVEVENKDPNANGMKSPLAITLQHKCYKIANYLIQYTPEFNQKYRGTTPLPIAAISHNSELLKRVIDSNTSFDKSTICHAVYLSIEYNDIKALKTLLNRFEVKDYCYCPYRDNLLQEATRNQKAFDFLLEYFNLDTIAMCAKDDKKLYHDVVREAIHYNNMDIIKLLITNGYKVNCDNLTYSIIYKNYEAFKFFINSGVDINCKNELFKDNMTYFYEYILESEREKYLKLI